MELMIVTRNFIILLAIYLLPALNVSAGGGHDHGHQHEDEHEHDSEKGPHGGKLFEKDGLTLELTIFEDGVPPQFRIYPFLHQKELPPQELTASVTLRRFGDKIEEIILTPEQTYLTSKQIIAKPHSFDVVVIARHQEKEYIWKYSSHEGRTELSDEALQIASLEFDAVGPAELSNSVKVYGRLIPNENKVAHLVPRFPGILKEIRKNLGDTVKRGETLAVVESNQGLQPYEIRSQIEGTVIKRHAVTGEFVDDQRELFIVADFSELWADFQMYRDDFGPITTGQTITVELGDGNTSSATVSYVSPVTDEITQSRLIRAVLPNENGTLRPGLFVSGVLEAAQFKVPLAVKREALQTFQDWDVVFASDGSAFQAMPVTLGKRDSKHVEILSGLEAGMKYVSKNSFIIKADIEKSGASHDH